MVPVEVGLEEVTCLNGPKMNLVHGENLDGLAVDQAGSGLRHGNKYEFVAFLEYLRASEYALTPPKASARCKPAQHSTACCC